MPEKIPQTTLLPLLIALLFALLGYGMGLRRPAGPARAVSSTHTRNWLAAMQTGMAYCVSEWFFLGPIPAIPPADRIRWFSLLAAGGVIYVIAESLIRPLPVTRIVTRMIPCGAAAWVIAGPGWASDGMEAAGLSIRIAAFAVLAVSNWYLIELLAHQRPGLTVPLCLGLTIVAMSVLMLGARSAKAAQLMGILGFPVLVLLVTSLIRRESSVAGGAIAILAILIPGFSLFAHVGAYPSYPQSFLALAPLCPLLAWIGEVPAIRTRRPRVAVLLAVLAVAIPLLVISVLAMRSYIEQSSGY